MSKTETIVKYQILVERDSTPVKGNCSASDDEEFDKQMEAEILERIKKKDIWAWCCITVVASYRGYEGRDSLGCCCYLNQQDFKQCDYYDQMKSAALSDLFSKLQPAHEAYQELILAYPSEED
ncbi:hypothetical protein FD723_40780 (plasmid) [Nostoc sp. C052]|uniref:hypothetical protein n=1 Tax=Nostoc sp. C052 TaxID=2576902 RepID=UPI0015C34337|nr:hypothetical protein [Nostoc sp. C052]QLE46551.1 hypothetical protein FD723_40780 [Nostoc sp. C052]